MRVMSYTFSSIELMNDKQVEFTHANKVEMKCYYENTTSAILSNQKNLFSNSDLEKRANSHGIH